MRLRLATPAVLSLTVLAGCSTVGDFGRPRYLSDIDSKPLIVVDPTHTGSVTISAYPLTDDERHLRALARGLLAPSYWSDAPFAAGGSIQTLHVAPRPDREAYAANLVHGPFRSATARYARLIDDTRNDITRLDPFFAVARRVADFDQKRERSLAHVSVLSADELANARLRVRENMAIMGDVHAMLSERVAMYRFALERLVIALPMPMAAEAERVRRDLERRVAAIQVVGPPVAVAGAPAAVSK